MTVTYISENDRDYAVSLKKAQTLKALRKHAEDWKFLARDAYEVIATPDFDFAEFQRGRKLENQDTFAGEEWAVKFGAVLIPELLFRVSIVAMEFGAPWGCAYIRLREMGRIDEQNGYAVWTESPEQ